MWHVATSTARRSTARQVFVLAGFIALCLAVGAIGGLATAQSVASWYPTLAKPSFNPPDWVFAPAWTTLYVLMAVAAWLVWRRAGWQRARPAFRLFALQLALNLAWSFLFFSFHQVGLALVDAALLLAAIGATALAFLSHSRLAALLLLPYLAWVSFATVLNGAILQLN